MAFLKIIAKEFLGFLSYLKIQVDVEAVEDLLSEVENGRRLEDGSPHLPQNG